MFEHIPFSSGRVTFNDPYFDPTKPVEQQMDILREDLFQSQWENGLKLAVGWYPCFNQNGRFRLVVIKDADWDSPVVTFETRVCGELVAEMLEILRRPEFATLRAP